MLFAIIETNSNFTPGFGEFLNLKVSKVIRPVYGLEP